MGGQIESGWKWLSSLPLGVNAIHDFIERVSTHLKWHARDDMRYVTGADLLNVDLIIIDIMIFGIKSHFDKFGQTNVSIGGGQGNEGDDKANRIIGFAPDAMCRECLCHTAGE